MTHKRSIDALNILDSLNDGVYATDLNRRIVYWSKSAERITGYRESDILGKRCCDNVLNHVDKDGRPLCGKENCPLYRSMITGEQATAPITLFAFGKQGNRIPMQVSVSPIRNPDNEIIGGVEIFRDLKQSILDLERAKKIQQLSMRSQFPPDDRIRFRTHYVPHDMIGGDFYAIERLDEDRYAFFLADVMGHGVAAALYTMHLKSSWEDCKDELNDPLRFMRTLNKHFSELVPEEGSFSTGVLCLFNVKTKKLQSVGAGGPHVIIVRKSGQIETIDCEGFPLGLLPDSEYQIVERDVCENERVLLFTDGAFEIVNPEREMLGEEGLIRLLKELGYPTSSFSFNAIEKSLLNYSKGIRLEDDLTFLEMHFIHSD